eukprot:1391221-Amorphochlora_amoeboformis.AAC.2
MVKYGSTLGLLVAEKPALIDPEPLSMTMGWFISIEDISEAKNITRINHIFTPRITFKFEAYSTQTLSSSLHALQSKIKPRSTDLQVAWGAGSWNAPSF